MPVKLIKLKKLYSMSLKFNKERNEDGKNHAESSLLDSWLLLLYHVLFFLVLKGKSHLLLLD